MIVYIDESGSINNHMPKNKYFIIAMVRVIDKDALKRAYKRFVSANYDRLLELDQDKISTNTEKVIKPGGKMFRNSKFRELKGSQFDKDMKEKFVEYFSRRQSFEIYYIEIANKKLSNEFCENISRLFNYVLRLALEYFFNKKYLPNEDCSLQIDERNERIETKHFLENYLNTELYMNKTTTSKFFVAYFDSVNNTLIQIADVFANIYYSYVQIGAYEEEIHKLKEQGILKSIFRFP